MGQPPLWFNITEMHLEYLHRKIAVASIYTAYRIISHYLLFKKILKIADWFDGPSAEQITTEGEIPERLYFIIDGEALIARDSKEFLVGPNVFIGELAYLIKKPATATVKLTDKAMGISWKTSSITKLLAANPQMKIAFDGLLNQDLASKLAK